MKNLKFWILDFGLSMFADVDVALLRAKYACHPERSEGSPTGSLRHAIATRVTELLVRDPSVRAGLAFSLGMTVL